ncbi:MAG: ribosome assembly factor SBDS [Nanoarchaeota archaeon]|nr:ribosome assembly factor SBDS [Nanoarchaeota archaeon]
MVSVDKAVIARLSRGKHVFEILVDSDKALEFKKGKPVSVDNILAVNTVFKDSKKGERAGSKELEDMFGTTDVVVIATKIIKDGDLQLTTDQRRKMVEEKRTQIITLIAKQAVNPKTQIPHPPQRISNAMDEAHVHVDPFKSAEDQMQGVLEKIRAIIPLSMEKVEVALKIPITAAGRASAYLRQVGTIKSEEWKEAYYAMVEIPAGMQAEIYGKLNDMTGGQVESRVVKTIKV